MYVFQDHPYTFNRQPLIWEDHFLSKHIFHFHLFVGFWHRRQLYIGFVLFPEKTPHWASCIFSLVSLVFLFPHYLGNLFSLVISRPQRHFCPLSKVTSSKPVCLLPLPGLESHRLWLPCEPQVSPPQTFLDIFKILFFETFPLFLQAWLFFLIGFLCKWQKHGKLFSCWGQWAKQHAEMCCFQLPRVPSLASQDPCVSVKILSVSLREYLISGKWALIG